jgi:hypothetical protein
MSDSQHVSLKTFGLRADTLACPAGGNHDVPEEAVRSAAGSGGVVVCVKCGNAVRLTSLR